MDFFKEFVGDLENGRVPDMEDPGLVFPADELEQDSGPEPTGSSGSSGSSDSSGSSQTEEQPAPKKPTSEPGGTPQSDDETPATTPASNSLYVEYEEDPETGELVLAGPYRNFPWVLWATEPGRGLCAAVSAEQAAHYIETGEMELER